MKKANFCVFLKKIYSNKRTIGSLLIILMGVFLLVKTAYLSSISSEKIIELTNKERLAENLQPISANQLLTKAAYEKGTEILKTQKFQHSINGNKFSNWVKNAGYRYSYTGENLALDFVTSEGVLKAWMKSPSHKKNIINKNFTEIGVAVLEGKFENKNSVLVVQIFATPLISTATNYNKNISLNNISPETIYKENFLTHSTAPTIDDKKILSHIKITSLVNNFKFNFNIINLKILLFIFYIIIWSFISVLFTNKLVIHKKI